MLSSTSREAEGRREVDPCETPQLNHIQYKSIHDANATHRWNQDRGPVSAKLAVYVPVSLPQIKSSPMY
jgi:hypothetical protein